MYFVILWLTFALDLTRAEIDAHYLSFFSHTVSVLVRIISPRNQVEVAA